MGRPVKKDILGTEVFGDYTTTAVGIKCEAYFSSNQSDVFIIKQKGASRYLVQDKSAGTTQVAKLVSGTPSELGEMRMIGYTGSGHSGIITIRSLKKRTATDWCGNRYTWYVENDSSQDMIRLTLI